MSLNPIILWSHKTGPNPWKVAIILEELGLPYENKFLTLAEVKEEPYLDLNPNGRVPTIQDPNTDLTIWESGAIIDYLCETYDTKRVLTPADSKTKWEARSWRDFQMSGQGPSFGLLSWFINYHPENVPSAIDRYSNEALRIISTIDRHLRDKDRQYLTSDAITYADLMWLPYKIMAMKLEVDLEKEFPNFYAWEQRMLQRPAVEKVWDEWMNMRAERKK